MRSRGSPGRQTANRTGEKRGPSHRARRRLSRRIPRRPNRDGVTVVEFAIIANVLFLCIFTCIEFNRVNMVRNMAQDAAYFAARTVMVQGATVAEAEAEVDRLMGSLISSGYETHVSEFDNDSNEVVVRVDVDLNAVALFTPMFFKNKTISSTARLSAERFNGFYRQ